MPSPFRMLIAGVAIIYSHASV